MSVDRTIYRATVNGRRCERMHFSNGEILYFAQTKDVRFPNFRLVPKKQRLFRAKIDKAIAEVEA